MKCRRVRGYKYYKRFTLTATEVTAIKFIQQTTSNKVNFIVRTRSLFLIQNETNGNEKSLEGSQAYRNNY